MYGLLVAVQSQQLSWEQLSSCVEGHTQECHFNNGRKAPISFGKCWRVCVRIAILSSRNIATVSCYVVALEHITTL